jgi:hypothetical protein
MKKAITSASRLRDDVSSSQFPAELPAIAHTTGRARTLAAAVAAQTMLGHPRPNESRIANSASSGAYEDANSTRRAVTVNMCCSFPSTERIEAC